MSPTIAMTAATIRQLLPLRRAIVVLVAEVAPAVLYLLMAGTFRDETVAFERLFFIAVILYLPLLVPLVSLVFASAALGAERRDGTLSFLVLRPIPRSVISTTKVGTAIVVAGVLNVFGALALSVSFSLETGIWSLVLPLALGGFVATVVYGAIFVPLGFFTDRAVLIGFVFVLIFEGAVISAARGLSALSPWRLGYSTFVALAPDELVALQVADLRIPTTTMSTTLLRAIVLAVLSIALVTMVLRQRDLASE